MKIAFSRGRLLSFALLISVCAVGFYVGRSYAAPELRSLDTCLSNTSPSSCLRTAVASLLDQYTPDEILRYVTGPDTSEAVRNRCHPIGHMIGTAAYERLGSVEAALPQCNNLCRSACTHGVIGAGMLTEQGVSYEEDIAHAEEDELFALAGKYCALSDSACHAVGHVAYLATLDDVRAVGICDTAEGSVQRQACYEGVFMERAGNFKNLLFPSEEMRVPPTVAGDYTYPCSSLPSEYRHACYLFLTAYQEPLFAADGIRAEADKLAKARSVCGSLEAKDRASCFSGIGTFSPAFGYASIVPDDIQPLCDSLSTLADRSACTLGVLPQFYYIELRGLYGYCEGINEEVRRSLCYDAAFQLVESKLGTRDDKARVCASYEACAMRYESYKTRRASLPEYTLGLPL